MSTFFVSRGLLVNGAKGDLVGSGMFLRVVGHALLPALPQHATPATAIASPLGQCRNEGTQCSTTSRTCVKVGLVGAPCEMSSDCSPFYICDATRHCSAGIALGAECTTSQRCANDGAFCDIPAGEITGTCTRPRADGEECQSELACQSRLCDLATRQCVPEPVCI